MTIDARSAQYMLECEARSWLRLGYQSAGQVGELMTRIEQRRGQPAADALRQEMRRQWKRRSEWMPAEN